MLKRALFFISIILPLLIIIKPVFEGNIPFWNDPGRDLLMAWDNLKKPTLIGPTSGIPGIFYGPHWIWLLSIGIAINKDPRFVVFLILTLPHFILLPLSIIKLQGKLIDWKTMMSIWILSIFALGSYANQIWSPNLAPLLFFVLLTLLYLTPKATEKLSVIRFSILGLIHGLLLQHQISFGVVLTAAWMLYFVLLLFERKNYKFLIINAGLFAAGFLVVLMPFFAFEIRHGFMQTKSLFFTLNQSITHNKAVVSQVGLTQFEIIQRFIERGAGALSLPKQFALGLVAVLVLFVFRNVKKKTIYSNNDENILSFICVVTLALFFVYFGTRNPVWDYHFIGVEILFIFLTILAVKKNNFLKSLLFVWAIILLIINTTSFVRSFNRLTQTSELTSKRETVKFILEDTKNTPFAYFGKNAAIYTYDYDYLFRWVGGMKNIYSSKPTTAENIYLIIPNEMKFDKVGFTENRTPSSKYITQKEWVRADKTIVIKRVQIH